VTSPPRTAAAARRSLGAGLLVGTGLAATLDEVVFHQLLHWHHFYDRGTSSAGLVSDGLFHAFGTVALVAGVFLLADLRRRGDGVPRRAWAGVLLGGGAFQVYDGLVQHKLLGLHQIRYDVDLLAYDLVWNGLGALLAVVGALLLLRR
jgi:uncharacterized membrane protein